MDVAQSFSSSVAAAVRRSDERKQSIFLNGVMNDTLCTFADRHRSLAPRRGEPTTPHRDDTREEGIYRTHLHDENLRHNPFNNADSLPTIPALRNGEQLSIHGT